MKINFEMKFMQPILFTLKASTLKHSTLESPPPSWLPPPSSSSQRPGTPSERRICPSSSNYSPSHPLLLPSPLSAKTTILSPHRYRHRSPRKSLSQSLLMGCRGKTPTIGCPTPTTRISSTIFVKKTLMPMLL